MAGTSLKAIFTAIYGALNVASFTALSTGGVFNGVPRNPTFPYTRIEGGSGEVRFDTMGRAGKEATVAVHVFSQYDGDAEALDICHKAIQLLHYASLSITGFDTVVVQHEATEPAGEEEIGGVVTTHWIVRFRVIVQETL